MHTAQPGSPTVKVTKLPAMAQALQSAGIKPKHSKAAHKQLPQKRPPQKPSRARQVTVTEKVAFQDGETFRIMLIVPRRLVPNGIQVLPAGGGQAPSSAPADDGRRRFRNAVIDLDGLMARATVERINVTEGANGFCTVYVECACTAGGEGFKHWAGAYENFVRPLLERPWDRITAKVVAPAFLRMQGKCEKDDIATKIHFAIAR